MTNINKSDLFKNMWKIRYHYAKQYNVSVITIMLSYCLKLSYIQTRAKQKEESEYITTIDGFMSVYNDNTSTFKSILTNSIIHCKNSSKSIIKKDLASGNQSANVDKVSAYYDIYYSYEKEDIEQDVFLKLIVHFNNNNKVEIEKIFSFYKRVCINAIYLRLRKQSKENSKHQKYYELLACNDKIGFDVVDGTDNTLKTVIKVDEIYNNLSLQDMYNLFYDDEKGKLKKDIIKLIGLDYGSMQEIANKLNISKQYLNKLKNQIQIQVGGYFGMNKTVKY